MLPSAASEITIAMPLFALAFDIFHLFVKDSLTTGTDFLRNPPTVAGIFAFKDLLAVWTFVLVLLLSHISSSPRHLQVRYLLA